MFLHDAVLEAIVCGDTEIPIDSLASEIERSDQNFETQFNLLSKVTPNPDEVISTIASEHGDKNRSAKYLPGINLYYAFLNIKCYKFSMLVDRYLVPSEDSNEYIHATFIDVRAKYIVCMLF